MIKRLAVFVLATILLITCVAYAEAPVKLTSVVTFGLDSYVLPGYDSQGRTITAIGENAFAGQNKLRVVALPSTICSIEDRAFAECTGLNAILIPETVVSFGDNLFQDSGERVTIIAPAESAAIRYAQQHEIRYIELAQRSIGEADTRYIALLMFKFAGNSTYFGSYNDTNAYLLTLNEADILNMALVNRMELTWNAIIDALRADGKNSYMTEQYMLQLGSILEEMHGIQSITVDTGLFQAFTSFAAKGADSYEELVTWLLGSEYRDDPFVRSVIANGDKLEYLSTALGGFDKVMNILIYACRDYSKSIAVLDTLLSVSSNYTDKEFHDAVLSLKRLYEGNVTGILSSLLSEFYVDIGEVVTDGVLESISTGALLLYNTANFGIDFALSVEGIKDEADAQMEYVALLDISYECEEAFMTIMSGNDNSPDTMAHLDVLIQLCRAIRLRLYDMQISMFRNSGNASAAEELSWSRAYFFQRADIVGSYAVDNAPQYTGTGDKLTTEPVANTSASYNNSTMQVSENYFQRYKEFLDASETTYMRAAICDLDFDGQPEVVAWHNVGRWGTDCHVIDIVDDVIVLFDLDNMTFGRYDTDLDLIRLPNGNLRWVAVYYIAAQGELCNGIWFLHYNENVGVEKEIWYYNRHRDPDIPRPGETYFVHDKEVSLIEYYQEVAVFDSAERVMVLPISEMDYPTCWEDAVDMYLNTQY